MSTPDVQLEAVVTMVNSLQGSAFYGQLICEFRNGDVTLLRLHQTLRPEEVYDGKTHKDTRAG